MLSAPSTAVTNCASPEWGNVAAGMLETPTPSGHANHVLTAIDWASMRPTTFSSFNRCVIAASIRSWKTDDSHQATAVHQPAEGAFHDPAFGQEGKPGHLGETFHDFHDQGGMLRLHPGGELWAVEAAVHPQFAQFRIVGQDGGQQSAGPFTFGAVGGFERDAQQQPQCVHEQETLAALGF